MSSLMGPYRVEQLVLRVNWIVHQRNLLWSNVIFDSLLQAFANPLFRDCFQVTSRENRIDDGCVRRFDFWWHYWRNLYQLLFESSNAGKRAYTYVPLSLPVGIVANWQARMNSELRYAEMLTDLSV